MSDFTETGSRNPFAGDIATVQQPTSGLIAVEQQKAIAEVQARMIIARANPRNPQRAMEAILNDCTRPSLAAGAIYAYARGGTDIAGPSIRLAETIARRWGNIASGIKELSRSGQYSECVAYAWDLETGYYDERQFQVRHWRDTRQGGYLIKDERDIYELIANMGQRRKRAVLLTVIPGDVVEAAVEQCEETLHTTTDISPEAIQKLAKAFAEFDVTPKMIEVRIQRKLEAIRPAQVVQLRKIYASLRDEMSTAADWFGSEGGGAWAEIEKRHEAAREEAAPAVERPTMADAKREVAARKKKPEPQPAQTASEAPVRKAEQQASAAPAAQEAPESPEFEYALLDEMGEPVDGIFYTDALSWAKAFAEIVTASQFANNIWEHNADAASDARDAGPESAAIIARLSDDTTAANQQEPEPPIIEPAIARGKPDWPQYIRDLTAALAGENATTLSRFVEAQRTRVEKFPASVRLQATKLVVERAKALGVTSPPGYAAMPQETAATDANGAAPPADKDRKTLDGILEHLGSLANEHEVQAYSNNAAVMTPLKRWEREGGDALAGELRAAFAKRIAEVKAGAT